MSDLARSAMTRTPIEIWWMILDEAIDSPKYFATTYNGDNWAHDSDVYTFRDDEKEYKEKEEQRLLIGCVCKTWRRFTMQRKYRSLRIGGAETGEHLHDIELKKALRVHILGEIDESTLSSIHQCADWQVVRIGHLESKEIDRLSLPHLRRLILSSRDYLEFDLNLYLGDPGTLANLTWLEFFAYYYRSWRSIPPTETKSPIILPKLRVFIYMTHRNFHFPFGNLELPSLQHFSVRCQMLGRHFPLTELLLPYRKHLKSFVVKIKAIRVEIKDLYFMQWNEVPNLQELVLDGPILLRFHPLPRDHPLNRLHARQWNVDEISSWMNSDNLRQIRLLGARWTNGALTGGHGTMTVSRPDMDQLLEKARARGIHLEAGWS
jgi:hypothetical protein